MRTLGLGMVAILGLVGLACGGVATPNGEPAFAVIAWQGDDPSEAAEVVAALKAERRFVREGYPRVISATDAVFGLPADRAVVLLGLPRSAEVAEALTGHARALGLTASHRAVTTSEAEDLHLWVLESSLVNWGPGVNGLDQRPEVVLEPEGFTVSMLTRERAPGRCALSKPSQTSDVAAVAGRVVIPWTPAEGQSPCLSVWPPSDRTVAACDTLRLEGLKSDTHPDPAALISRIPMAKAYCFEEHGP